MEELVITIIVIVLVVYLIGGALTTLGYWGTAALISIGSGLVIALVRSIAIRRPRSLAHILNPRWNAGDATLSWRVNSAELEKRSAAVAAAVLAAIPGAVFLVSGASQFLAPVRSSDAEVERLFRIGGGGIMAIAGLIGASLLTHKWTLNLCERKVEAVTGEFTAATEQLQALAAAEREIRDMADEIGLSWPLGMSEDIGEYVLREREALLINGKEFRRRVAVAVEQAATDSAMLRKGKVASDETIGCFRRAALTVNRSGAITLIREMEAMHDAMQSTAMMSLLLDRKLTEFEDVHREMRADLQRLERQAVEFSPADIEQPETAAEDRLITALKTLGVTADMSPELIKKRYRELVMDYHPDKANQATPAIQALTAERFKEIQEAWEIVRAELQPA
ncbi:MAG: J domain-containing protein [Chthoniobacterales bacterium]